MVRRLQGQDGEVVGEDMSATPKTIFQFLNQVIDQCILTAVIFMQYILLWKIFWRLVD